MCFSAEASFVAAAVLGVAGVATIASASPRLLPIAMTPLLFALQQLAEGILWVASAKGQLEGQTAQIALWIYVTFAYLIWPVWMPLMLAIAEPLRRPRLLLWTLTAAGGALLWLNSQSLSHSTPQLTLTCCSLSYSVSFHPATLMLYPLCTILPFLLSSLPLAHTCGLAIAAAAAVAAFLFFHTFASVWCFFAAWVSLLLFFMVRRARPLS